MRLPILIRAGLLALFATATACGPAAGPSPVPSAAPIVQLVDSVAWADEMSEGTLRRVEVRHGARTDTIPDVLTETLPVLAGGSRLVGFSYTRGDVTGAYEYDLRTRRLWTHALPDDLNPGFSSPALAPDARHLAYVVLPGDGQGYAIARTWPDKQVVWRSNAVTVPATDAAGGNLVRWLSPDTAEVFIETGVSTDSLWHRVRGSVRQRAVVSADTVFELPQQ